VVKEIIMYAVMRYHEFDANQREEVDRKVREELVPIIRETPGFIAYYWLDTGEGQGVSFSVFEDKAGANESTRLAADLVRAHPAWQASKREIIEGPVEAHATQEVPANA
jgi:quinol monooxygenase YgiN